MCLNIRLLMKTNKITLAINQKNASDALSTSFVIDKRAKPIKIGNVSKRFFRALLALFS